MEAQEVRANLYGLHRVVPTENDRLLPNSSKLRLWQLADLRVQRLERLLHKAQLHREECLEQLNDQQR
jgi:hypothetical protein